MYKNFINCNRMLNYKLYSNDLIDNKIMRSSTKTFSLSNKKFLTLWFLILTLITIVLIFYTEPDLFSEEQSIMKRLGELHIKEQHLSLWFRLLKEETSIALHRLNYMLASLPSNYSTNFEIQKMLNNFSKIASLYLEPNGVLKPPTIFQFLPHLLSNSSSLQPLYYFSKHRSGVSVIIGIPTARRSTQSYLLDTLNDLIQKMDIHEKEDTLIVVFIAETDERYVLLIVNEIKSLFANELETGLIDIISPPASFYPDFEKLRLTLSDPLERVRWRSKQCLDFAFLMMYSYPKGIFYVQLEDDILAKPNFLSTMKDVALKRTANNQEWFVLDFCQLGFIGKMFRCIDLPWIIQFFFMFYNDKPVDWLLDGLIQTKVCNLEKNNEDCKIQKDKFWVHNKPSLFQHIGTTSSLKGKVQKLKDKQFGEIPLFYPHHNPPAEVHSSIKSYKQHTLNRAYNGETYFWGLMPQTGDWMSFQFKKWIKIRKYRFKTGNVEYPSDKLYNASVIAALVPKNSYFSSPTLSSHTVQQQSFNNTYVTLGSFNKLGIAEATMKEIIGYISELRIVVHKNSLNWVILSEILIEEQ